MPQMICKSQPLEYAGKTYQPGERFEAEEGHVGLLTKMGRAEVPPVSEPDPDEVTRSSPRGRGRPKDR